MSVFLSSKDKRVTTADQYARYSVKYLGIVQGSIGCLTRKVSLKSESKSERL